jgi:hypothetical protein
LAAVLAASPAAGVAAPLWLTHPFDLHLGGRRAGKASAQRYAIDGGGSFVLSSDPAGSLLKFDDSPEIWALNQARGPRADMIFSNDVGQALLRTTRLGGATVFTRRRPEGVAATPRGPSGPITLSRVELSQLFRRMLAASARASRAAGRPIEIEAVGPDAASSSIMADAALVASQAVVDLAAEPGGRARMAQIYRLEIAPGPLQGASRRAGVVSITVTPSRGLFGRPSSAMILRALGGYAPSRFP